MPGRLEASTSWHSHAAAQDPLPAERRAVHRLLLVADFSGRGSRSAHDAPGLRERRAVAVDFERFYPVMRAMAPRLALPEGTLQVDSLDDFHPDRLTARLPLLAQHDLAPAGNAPHDEDDNATIGRLLGRGPAPPQAAPAPAVAAAVGIDALLRRVVAPHVMSASPSRLPQETAALAERLRSVLADRGLQAVETAWRSVDLLLSRLNFDEGLELHLLDCTRDEITADLVAAGGQADATGLLHALTAGRASQPDDAPWLAVVGLYDFDQSTLDLGLLAALGTVAQRCNAPFIGGAATPLLQATWQDGTNADWQTLRHSAVAPWLALAGPRLLLRTPYGRAGEAVEAMAFEEVDESGQLAGLLWAPASLLCALAIGQAVNEDQPNALNPRSFEANGLPAVLTDDRGLLCAELRLGEAESGALHDQGLTALRGDKGRHSLTISAVHSLAGTPLGGG